MLKKSFSIGIPSADMTYAGKVFYPVYHSVHDTYKWLQGFIDPYFKFHLVTAKVASKLLMDMADSFVLPIDVTEYGKSLNNSLKVLRKHHGKELENNNITLRHIEKAIRKYGKYTYKHAHSSHRNQHDVE